MGRRNREVGNSWKSRKLARKFRVYISSGMGQIKESLETKLATLRYGSILRRTGILGGPGIRGKETVYSKKTNSPSLRSVTEQRKIGSWEAWGTLEGQIRLSFISSNWGQGWSWRTSREKPSGPTMGGKEKCELRKQPGSITMRALSFQVPQFLIQAPFLNCRYCWKG